MSTVVRFPLSPVATARGANPLPLALRPGAPEPPRRSQHLTLADVAARLALAGRTTTRRTVIAKLRALALAASLPLPVNPRIVAGRVIGGAGGIHAASLWDRGEFLAWLDGYRVNPDTAADASPRRTPPATPALRDSLRQRAVALATQGGRR